jgi:hypothetical protein
MADSHKARYGQHCKHWKDTMLASRSQKSAWAKRKKIRTQQERARTKAALRKDDNG